MCQGHATGKHKLLHVHIAVQVGSVECVKVMLQVNTNYCTIYSCTGGFSRVCQGHASGKHNYCTIYSCTGGISRVCQGHASGKHKLLHYI